MLKLNWTPEEEKEYVYNHSVLFNNYTVGKTYEEWLLPVFIVNQGIIIDPRTFLPENRYIFWLMNQSFQFIIVSIAIQNFSTLTKEPTPTILSLTTWTKMKFEVMEVRQENILIYVGRDSIFPI
jgi:hypothetical protein